MRGEYPSWHKFRQQGWRLVQRILLRCALPNVGHGLQQPRYGISLTKSYAKTDVSLAEKTFHILSVSMLHIILDVYEAVEGHVTLRQLYTKTSQS